jgi:hypothetical protein
MMNNGCNFPSTLRSFGKKKIKIKIDGDAVNNGYFFLVIERENQMGLAFFLLIFLFCIFFP